MGHDPLSCLKNKHHLIGLPTWCFLPVSQMFPQMGHDNWALEDAVGFLTRFLASNFNHRETIQQFWLAKAPRLHDKYQKRAWKNNGWIFFWKNIYKEARHIICILFAVFASTLDPYPGQNRKVLCSLKHISTPSISSTSTSFRIFLHIYISATSRINHLHTKRSRICKTAWSWL